MKNYLQQILRYFRPQRDHKYIYQVDQSEFHENPTKIRTSEMSQIQDETRDIETRSPEREAFDNHKFETYKGTYS